MPLGGETYVMTLPVREKDNAKRHTYKSSRSETLRDKYIGKHALK